MPIGEPAALRANNRVYWEVDRKEGLVLAGWVCAIHHVAVGGRTYSTLSERLAEAIEFKLIAASVFVLKTPIEGGLVLFSVGIPGPFKSKSSFPLSPPPAPQVHGVDTKMLPCFRGALRTLEHSKVPDHSIIVFASEIRLHCT